MLAPPEGHADPPGHRPGETALEGGDGHRDVVGRQALEHLLEPVLGCLQLLQIGGVCFLAVYDLGQQLLLAPSVGVEGPARALEAPPQLQRLTGPAFELGAGRGEGGQVGAESGDALVVAAGEGAHEAVAAEDVRRPVHRQQHSQVGQLAELVERPRAGGQHGPGGGDRGLELAGPAQGRVHLLARPLEHELGLSQLLPPQAHLQLQPLHLPEQAALLGAQAGQVPLQGHPPLLDRAQPLVGGGRGRRGRDRGGRGPR